jgi:hypothetical protein
MKDSDYFLTGLSIVIGLGSLFASYQISGRIDPGLIFDTNPVDGNPSYESIGGIFTLLGYTGIAATTSLLFSNFNKESLDDRF